jgi:exopolyphosphatase/guanosine-5'-triphosphate,3'-diphosphate pyrophosphatase
MNLAVIDLGTNTCNLLVAGINNTTYQIRYQGKLGVKLGKDGIHKNRLTQEGGFGPQYPQTDHLPVGRGR